jgi:hypothetical protein
MTTKLLFPLHITCEKHFRNIIVANKDFVLDVLVKEAKLADQIARTTAGILTSHARTKNATPSSHKGDSLEAVLFNDITDALDHMPSCLIHRNKIGIDIVVQYKKIKIGIECKNKLRCSKEDIQKAVRDATRQKLNCVILVSPTGPIPKSNLLQTPAVNNKNPFAISPILNVILIKSRCSVTITSIIRTVLAEKNAMSDEEASRRLGTTLTAIVTAKTAAQRAQQEIENVIAALEDARQAAST